MDTELKKKERSVAYPGNALLQAVENASVLRNALGKGPYGREEACIALGHKGVSGAAATKIATLVHFGLLNRYGNTYSQSELAERINHPLSDTDRTVAIAESAKMPKLYKDLVQQFAGQALPTQLANLLIRKGVSAKVSKTVAEDFKITMEFAGLLVNGVLIGDVDLSEVKQAGVTLVDDKQVAPVLDVAVVDVEVKDYVFTDTGKNWSLKVTSKLPLTAALKKLLIEAMEVLESNNEK